MYFNSHMGPEAAIVDNTDVTEHLLSQKVLLDTAARVLFCSSVHFHIICSALS